MSKDYRGITVDHESVERLGSQGLVFGIVDTAQPSAVDHWLFAEGRGFYEGHSSQEDIAEQRRGVGANRLTAVWDATALDAEIPVATTSAWPTRLTVPGEESVPAWAISGVTVSPAYRRRGIARGLLEAELRTAHRLDIPVAVLTASEATIYGRFGFAPATMSVELTVDTRRASWTGPVASGRLQFVSAEQLRVDGREILNRVRLSIPGGIDMPEHKWDRILGLAGDRNAAKSLRAIRCEDNEGTPQGFAIYRVTEDSRPHADHNLELSYLVAATADAYQGLWQYLVQLDLVGTVSAQRRPVDESLAWALADFRSAQKSHQRDHLWARILDVGAALSARRYRAPGRILLEVSDPLGFAEGRFLVEIDAAGVAEVSRRVEPVTDADAALALTVNELGALYLGGASAVSFAQVGRVTELMPGSALAFDDSFRSAVAPWLSFSF